VQAAGREELTRWLQEPTPPMDTRDELMVKLRADAVMGPQGLDAEIERRLETHQTKLKAYRSIEQRDFPDSATLSREARIQHMILKTGIMYEQGWTQWCKEALKMLREVPA
jgi:thioesterase domain-containing protein